MRCQQIHAVGGPEVMKWEEVAVPAPGPGQVLLRQRAIGVNFIDVYFRTGLYKAPAMPFVPGQEGAGMVEAVGEGVTTVQVGARVGYAGLLGGYAELRLVAAERLIALPDDVDDEAAAALLLKGLTAQYLVRQIGRITAGDVVLVHAAAGGVGLLACSWARALGATVIGTVGSDAKAALAAEHGCTHPIVYTRENFVTRVRELTGGDGVRVAFDGVGKDTFLGTLDCMRRLGVVASFGQSSGPIAPIEVSLLAAKGSLTLTRPRLHDYTHVPADQATMAADLWSALRQGHLRATIGARHPLSEAAAAHRALEGRATTGASILLP